jgi:hypothetical protein
MATKISPRIAGVPRGFEQPLPLRALLVSGLIAVLGGVALLVYVVGRQQAGPTSALAAGEYAVFAGFGPGADSVFETRANPEARPRLLFQIPHAADYGIVPATAPDGASFAYTVLPVDTKAPAPDSPAELWVAGTSASSTPRRLGSGFDLLVRPLWSPDQGSLAVRRSEGTDGPFELVAVDAESGVQTKLVSSENALFPVAFLADGSLFYVAVSPQGSDLMRLAPGASDPVLVVRLSDDLTRDWALSPSGNRLAFVTLSQTASRVASTIEVLDLRSLEITAADEGGVDEAGPVWAPDGTLSIGRIVSRHGGVIAGERTLASPDRGFDVPLGWSRSGKTVAVRSFDGSSAASPGNVSLAIVFAGGGRRTLAFGEVTFIGWAYH